MKHLVLDKFVSLGLIIRYDLDNVDDEGHVGKSSSVRNTERLVLHFNGGEKLVIESFCSDSLQNTVLGISD